jgi:hypothetical protein
MMMAEAMAMSASKRTLCLRRSILRMRFIATASPVKLGVGRLSMVR